MPKFAIIENNLVLNIIEADENFLKSLNVDYQMETTKTGPACIGGLFADGKFNPRELTEQELQGLAEKEAREKEMLNNQ